MFRQLTVLGSGSIIPHEDRSCAAYVIHTDAGFLLVDCGPGSLLRLHQAGVSLTEVGTILISHFHLDHVSDLLPILHSRRLQGGRERSPPVIIGPRGLRRRFRRLRKTEDWLRKQELRLIEMGSGGIRLGELAVDACLTGHTRESICFRLTDAGGRVLFYSGDADDYRTLVPLSSCADLALVECSWSEAPAWEGHLTPEMSGRLAAEARARRLVLTHFYQPVRREAMLNEVGRHYAGPIELAADLKRYSIVRD